MNQLEQGLWATIAAGAGPVMFARAFRDLRLRNMIQNTPTARIRSMAMGMVEVNGVITPRSHLIAPFSGRPCAHWQVEIATRSGTRQRGSWTTVHRNSSGNPFYLSDDTGVALIYPKSAEVQIAFGVEEETGGLGVPECYATYMKEQNLGLRVMWSLGAMRFRERVLEEQQQVYVLGRANPKPQSLTVSADVDVELARTGTDHAHSGMADLRARRLEGLDHKVTAVLRRGSGDPVFLISQKSERELSLMLGLRSAGFAIAGPVLTVVGLGWWLYRLSHGAFQK